MQRKSLAADTVTARLLYSQNRARKTRTMDKQNERPDKDNRFDLTIDPDCSEKLITAVNATRGLVKDRPMVALKISLDMQKMYRIIEQEAAEQAHGRFMISWKKIGEMLGRNSQWAWERYVSSRLSHPKSRRLSKKSPAEMEEQPDDQ